MERVWVWVGYMWSGRGTKTGCVRGRLGKGGQGISMAGGEGSSPNLHSHTSRSFHTYSPLYAG